MKGAVQKAVQYPVAVSRTESQTDRAHSKKPREMQPLAASCEAGRRDEADGVGFEPTDAFRRQ